MSTAQDYIAWIRKTLESARYRAPEARDAILRGGMCLGAVLPAEHLAEIRTALLPELDALIATFPPPPKRPPPRWPQRTDAEERALRARLAALPATDAPYPYVRYRAYAIGGLRSAGFAPGTELLLVVSWQGSGVFDGATLAKVGRDRREPRHDGDLAIGIGPIEGVRVPVMGIETALALPRQTPDGWSLGVLSPDYDATIWLTPPGCSVDSPALAVHAARLARTFEEVRVAGFSASGASLVIGEPHTLHLFHRA